MDLDDLMGHSISDIQKCVTESVNQCNILLKGYVTDINAIHYI